MECQQGLVHVAHVSLGHEPASWGAQHLKDLQLNLQLKKGVVGIEYKVGPY